MSLALYTVHTGMAEVLEEEVWVHEAEELEVTPVPSAISGRTIPVEGRAERRPEAPPQPPPERRPVVQEAGPSIPPPKEAPRAPPPVAGAPSVAAAPAITAAPAAGPPERPPARPIAEAAAPARPARAEKKGRIGKLRDRLVGVGRGHWAHWGGVLLRFLQLAAFCIAFSVIAASGDNGLLFSDFQVGN